MELYKIVENNYMNTIEDILLKWVSVNIPSYINNLSYNDEEITFNIDISNIEYNLKIDYNNNTSWNLIFNDNFPSEKKYKINNLIENINLDYSKFLLSSINNNCFVSNDSSTLCKKNNYLYILLNIIETKIDLYDFETDTINNSDIEILSIDSSEE